MKSKVLVSSILTIARCLSLIAGSTFALFTDSTDMNIAITSGDVEVAANIAIAGIYSAEGSGDVFEDKYLVDEYDSYYTHADKNLGNFTNGGTAVVDGNVLKMDRVTPGDKVAATVTIKNDGDVAMIYRYKIVSNNTKLANGMVITLDTPDGEATPYEGFASFTSYWSAPVLPGVELTHNLSVELPVYAGNEYENGSVEYAIAVEAVQSNAVTSEAETLYDDAFVVTTAAELQAALNNVDGNYYIYVANDLEGDVTLKQRANAQFTINGNGHKFAGAITIDGGRELPGMTREDNAAVTIKNFYFKTAGSPSSNDAYIRLGVPGKTTDCTNTLYTRNVTVENCSFGGSDQKAVGIKSASGGDLNLTVKGCVANVGTHSLLQLANVEKGLEILDCRVYSKNGASLGASEEATIDGCIFYNLGYNVRFGSGSAANTEFEKLFTISNCVLNSVCDEGDASIMFRGNSVWSTLNVYNTTINASKAYEGIVSGKTTVIADVYETADLDAAFAVVPAGGIVKFVEDLGAVTIANDLKDVTIDMNANNAKLTFTGNLENVAVANVADSASDNGFALDVSGASGNVVVKDSAFKCGGTTNSAIKLGRSVDVAMDNCSFTGTGKSYGVWSTTGGALTITNCEFKNMGSWAVLVNGTQYGDLVVDNCEFTNCASGIAKAGIAGGGASGLLEGNFVFTNNTITGCSGKDGSTTKWFEVKYVGSAIVSGNVKDGAVWNPDSTNGLTDTNP